MDIEQARQLARDETTASEVLRELAFSTDSITRQYVVMNPNVSPDILIELAGQFPKQVFNNPAIDLLLLTTPNLFSGTLANALCSLLKRKVPMRTIEYAADSTDEKLKLAILMNPQTSQKIVEQLAKNSNAEVSEAAKTHINYYLNIDDDYQFVREKIERTLEQSNKYMEFEIAFNKVKNYPSFFDGIYEHTGMAYDTFTRKNAEALSKKSTLEAPSLSDEDIERLSKLKHHDFFKNISFLHRVAANPNTPVYLLEQIADLDKYRKTHLHLACNCNISPKIIEKLLERFKDNPISYGGYNNDTRIHHKIISNPATPIEILEALANHPYSQVKALAANNSLMPKYLVKRILLGFENENFDFATIEREYRNLIKNPLLSGKLIDRLISFSELKKKSVKNHNYRAYGKPLWMQELMILAKHPNINSVSLKTLLEHEEKSIRNSALSNIKTPQYIAYEWGLEFLDTLNISQLQTIARNIFTPEIILEKLVQYDNNYYYVVQDVLSNPCITDRTLQIWENLPSRNSRLLVNISNDRQRFLELWKLLLSDCNRLTILLDTRTPIPLLIKISASTSWLERYAITQNQNTPLPIIQKLAKDGNRIVRAAARANLKTT